MKSLLIDDLRNIDADVITRTFDAGIDALKYLGPFEVLYLDHDLGEEDPHKTGYGIMNFLEVNPKFLPKKIVLVTSNPIGRKNMQAVIDKLYGEKYE